MRRQRRHDRHGAASRHRRLLQRGGAKRNISQDAAAVALHHRITSVSTKTRDDAVKRAGAYNSEHSTSQEKHQSAV